MFKCNECGAEFEVKPDYCDCGNDEFEEIINEQTPPQKEETKIEQQEINKIKPQPAAAVSKQVNNIPTQKTKTFNEQFPMSVGAISSLDPISVGIFIVCIILSFCVALFMWNPKPQDLTAEKTDSVQPSKNIPSINKIWNDTIPKNTAVNPKPQVTITNNQPAVTQQKITNKITPQKTQPAKTASITVPAIKPAKTQTKISAVQVNSTKKTQTVNVNTAQEQAKKIAQTAAQKKAEEERKAALKAAEEAQLKKLQAEQAKKAAEEKIKKAAAQKEEFANYKANLRNTLGRKIDFTKVIGDGSCSVTFKIDTNGKLTNRSFSKQSSNNTLNDAVYAAVMATPAFMPPPAGYSNEFLTLNIRFSNGNFEISLK